MISTVPHRDQEFTTLNPKSTSISTENCTVPASNVGVLTPIDGSQEARSGSLGKITSTLTTIDFKEEISTEFQSFVSEAQSITPKSAPADRYRLQAIHADLLPSMRVAKCGKYFRHGSEATIKRASASGACYLSGVMRCGSVWTCPVCAAKLATARRVELMEATYAVKKQGLHLALLTATIPHAMGDDLDQLLKLIAKAWSGMFAGRDAKMVSQQIGRIGMIRSIEITYGDNGFHPHIHAIIVHDGSKSLDDIQRRFRSRWRKNCLIQGLGRPSYEHGLTVQDGHKATDYICKRGIESEMTHSHSKVGKLGSMTPWDLSRAAAEGGPDSQKYAALFRAYAKATKGTRQLYWSNGLRARLGITAETDDEILNNDPVNDQVVYTLDRFELKAIHRYRCMPFILYLAEKQPLALRHTIRCFTDQLVRAEYGGPLR